ncbi:MAG: UDP-N-acetylmuramate:L-alanyl-gamma-D-glutamyl-meso-diaminopimelate ligase [Nitrospinae bacterium]|nr:UDP-N-acetylmuramate:L-alanyl-gamma-D-glutamyl-meso-diaminopimelate ligase [Nitrospinota bacterium]
MNSNNVKSIYMVAICGTGMASLAGLLNEAGYRVTGSDVNVYPPMSDLLAHCGIPVKPGFKKENITEDIDLAVIGNAVSKTNEEAQAILEKGIPYVSFPQALSRFFLDGRKSLVVAGTHGKTTTTSLLSWILHSAGRNPGFMVGGWLKNFDCNYRLPQGDFFVTEGDEYDTAFFDKGPKFLHYRPYAAILTGIEFDHADIYRDLDHIKSAFAQFARIVDPSGFLVVEHSDPNARDILDKAPCKVETYGFDPAADWSVASYRFGEGQGQFALVRRGQALGEFALPMMGRHNALNAAAATAVALNLGLSVEEVRAALRTFRGVKRRQEIVGEKNGMVVLDDFAHHPTAIHLTLEAVKEAFPGRRIWAVFEPRSATSRRNVFQDSFPPSFRLADKIIVAGLFAPEKIKPEERLDPEKMTQDLRRMGKEAYFIPEAGQIVEFMVSHNEKRDVALIMSSGGFSGIHRTLLARL